MSESARAGKVAGSTAESAVVDYVAVEAWSTWPATKRPAAMAANTPKARVGRREASDYERLPMSESSETLLLNAKHAAELCCCSERRWRDWHAMGLVPVPIHIGRAIFWRADELRAWVEAGCPNRKKWLAQNDDLG